MMEHNRYPQPSNTDRLPTLREAMQQLFNESFWDPFETSSRMPAVGTFPRVDVSEDDKNVFVTANIPGVDAEKIDIEVDDDVLTLSGTIEQEDKKEDEERQYYHYEREYGEFRRTIPLPSAVKGEEARAKAKNGVLTVTIPKTEGSTK